MEETYTTKAIIIKNRAFRERDSLLDVYTLDYGRKSLVARGTKSIKSKLAGHIEAFSLLDIMIIKGKKWNYLGAAVTKDAFLKIRREFEKIELANKALKIYIDHVKPEDKEENLFFLLKDYLEVLNTKKVDDVIFYFFLLKFMLCTGLSPELYYCVETGHKITPKKHFFDYSKGGVVQKKENGYTLTISENCIKIMRTVLKVDFYQITKIKIDAKLKKEYIHIVDHFFKYNYNH